MLHDQQDAWSGRGQVFQFKGRLYLHAGASGKETALYGTGLRTVARMDEKKALDWYLADKDSHRSLQKYVRDLLHLYKKYPCLYSWIMTGMASSGSMPMMGTGVFSALSAGMRLEKEPAVCYKFTPVPRPDYRVGVPKKCKYTLLLDQEHGAYKASQCPTYTSAKGECDGQPYSIAYPLGPTALPSSVSDPAAKTG